MSEMSLLNVKKFNGANWTSWVENLSSVLAVKEPGAWSFVKNGVPNVGTSKVTQEDEEKGLRIRAYIYLTCEEAIQRDIAGVYCPKAAFEKLQKTYQAKLSLRLFQLETQWDSLEKHVRENVDQYFARVTELRLQLEDAGVTKSDVTVVNSVLRGLSKMYDPIKNIILNLDETLMTLESVKPRLLAFEAGLEGHDRSDAKALVASVVREKKRSSMECWNCGEEGHKKADCRKKGGGKYKGGDDHKEHAM